MLNQTIFHPFHTVATNQAMYAIVRDLISHATPAFKDGFIAELNKQFGNTVALSNNKQKVEKACFGDISEKTHLEHLAKLINHKHKFRPFYVFHYHGIPQYLKFGEYIQDCECLAGITTLPYLTSDEIEDLARTIDANDMHAMLHFSLSEVDSSLAQIVTNELLGILLDVKIDNNRLIQNALSRLALLVLNQDLGEQSNSHYKNLLKGLLKLNAKSSLSFGTNDLKVDLFFRCNDFHKSTPAALLELQSLFD